MSAADSCCVVPLLCTILLNAACTQLTHTRTSFIAAGSRRATATGVRRGAALCNLARCTACLWQQTMPT